MKIRILISAALVCLLPALVCRFLYAQPPQTAQIPQQTPASEQAEAGRNVRLLTHSGVKTVPLEDYVTAVVLGEMPAEFEPEALKAQAVVARTFTCKKVENAKHTQADVCTDPGCCQAYCAVEDYLAAGGTQRAVEKVSRAVADTEGLVLMYDRALIEATYFSCSGGRTEDALAVWGTQVPYLQSVESPGEEKAAYFTDTVSFSAEEFCQRLGIRCTGSPGSWIGQITYTQGGGVDRVQIGQQLFTGLQLRQLLQLRSTAFVITGAGDRVIITTKGFGHRVGMSQYGAEAMAVKGADFAQILSHYFQGTTLTDLSG